MNIWRQQQEIQCKVLGLIWRHKHLLASEIYRDDGSVKGVRPLGGRVEFGEAWQEALTREFHEELGVQVEVIGQPIFMENIYAHENMLGHEVVIISDVFLPSDTYLDDEVIEYFEDNGEKCYARWYNIEHLDCGGLELYPNGLKTILQDRLKT